MLSILPRHPRYNGRLSNNVSETLQKKSDFLDIDTKDANRYLVKNNK